MWGFLWGVDIYVSINYRFIKYLYLISGGEGGIRTLEGLQTLASFQDWCIQPLCHLSGSQGRTTAHFGTRSAVIQ